MNFKIAIVAGMIFLQGCAAVVATGAATGVGVMRDRRGTYTFLDDKNIELTAYQDIRKIAKQSTDYHISVASYNGVVLLVGQAPSSLEKQKVVERIKGIEKIVRLYDEITVEPPISLGERSQDAWITACVKSQFLVHKEIDPTRFKVITEQGTVYLLGLVTPEEENIAATVASQVPHVQKVVKIFEHFDRKEPIKTNKMSAKSREDHNMSESSWVKE